VLLAAIGQPVKDEGTSVAQIASATESGTTVTITTATANNLAVGQQVAVDGRVTVLQVPTTTSFTYTAASSGLGAVNDSGTATSFDDSALSQSPGSAPYVPILAYPDLPSQASTIVGFAYYVQWTYNKAAMTLTLNPASAMATVGNQNASGVMAVPLPAALSQQDQGTLFRDHDALANPPYAPPLYAPVLVDHYLGPNATAGN
jgi:hypothetical protein